MTKDGRSPIGTGVLKELKSLANAQDVAYRSLMKVFLAERITRKAAAARPLERGGRATTP